MSLQQKTSEKMNTLTARQFNSDFRKKNNIYRLSYDSQEFRKTQPIKASRLKSTNIESGDQYGSILNDYSSIEAISQNHNKLSKQKPQDKKNSQIQTSFFETMSAREYLNPNQFGASQSRNTNNQNNQILKFQKLDQMNTTLQMSGQLSFQKSESTRFQSNGQFLFTQNNSNTFKEDSILDGFKRRPSQLTQPNNNSILRDLYQKPNSQIQQFNQKDEYSQSENSKQQNSNLSPFSKGNILTLAVGKNNDEKLSSQLLKTKDVEKIIQLRKKGLKLKKNENFYLQLISNDELTLPKYEKEFPSIRREKYLENLKLEQKNQASANGSQSQKTPFQIELEDGSILDIEKVKNLTDCLQKSHRIIYHNSQNSQFKKPDERKDTKILSEWLDNMINKVYNEQITSYYDFYEKFELIFDGIISEISRQLKTTCTERAQLLTKVWTIYSTVISEFFQKTQQTNIKIEAENFKRVNNVHKMYLNDIISQNQQIKELYEKLETKENYMNKLRSENRYLRKKWQKLEKGNEIQQQHLEQYMQMYEDSVKENQGLKMKMEGIMLTQQNDILDQFNRTDIQDKFNDEIEKIRNNLYEYFSSLYDEQKSKLMEAYQLKQNLKEKEILLAQKIEEEDEEYQKNLKNKLNAADYESVDDNILDNKCIDTSDLFKTESIGVDTSSLVKYEDVEIQATPAPIKQVSVSIQVAAKVASREIQADMRNLLTDNLEDFFKFTSKKASITSLNSLDNDKMIKQSSNNSDSQRQKSSFYKLQRTSKNLVVGFQFLKEASLKKGQELDEKLGNYQKYQEIAQNFESKQEDQNTLSIENNLLELKDEVLIQLNQNEIYQSEDLKLKCNNKKQNSKVNSEYQNSESDQSDKESQNSNESGSQSDDQSEIQNQSSHIILTGLNLKSQKNLQQQNYDNSSYQLFKFIQNQEDQQAENNLLNQISDQNLIKDSGSISPVKIENKFNFDKNNESQSDQSNISKDISRIKGDEEIYKKRKSSVLSQIIDNARVSLSLDAKTKQSSFSFSQEQIPKKVPDIQIRKEEEEIQSQKLVQQNSSPKSEKMNMNTNEVIQQNKISTKQLLKELNLITPVDNIFKRLRVSLNSNKVTRQSTKIIEKVIQKIKKKKDQVLDLKEQKLTNILKVFGNIMVDLMKYLKKNTNNTFPYFHAYSFDYFINNYGYSQSTEKKFKETVYCCYQLKNQHSRVNMFFNLLVGEIDYIDYKFLLELIQKIDDTNQNGVGVFQNTNDKIFIGWSKAYEFFMSYFGQVVPLKKYQVYDRQILQMKNKTIHANKVMINADEAISFMMNIYVEEVKQSFCQNYFDLYFIADIYDINFLTLDQFFFIYYSIEPKEDQLGKDELTQIFMQEHDLQFSIANSNKFYGIFDESIAFLQKFTHLQLIEYGIQKDFIYGMSIFRFCQICIDYNFLSLIKQQKFIGHSIEAQVGLLRQEFDSKIEQIQKRFIQSSKYNIIYHLQIKALKRYLMLDDEKYTQNDFLFEDKLLENNKQAIINYKLLDHASSQHFIDYIIERDLLISPFKQIQQNFLKINKKLRNMQKNITRLLQQK